MPVVQPGHELLAAPGGDGPLFGDPGSVGEVCTAPELRVEAVCRAADAERVLAAVRRAHPYEEPVINVIPLWKTGLA